jgi:hypothetical protein
MRISRRNILIFRAPNLTRRSGSFPGSCGGRRFCAGMRGARSRRLPFWPAARTGTQPDRRTHSYPALIVSDTGTELTSHAILRWQEERSVYGATSRPTDRNKAGSLRDSMAASEMNASTSSSFRTSPLHVRLLH